MMRWSLLVLAVLMPLAAVAAEKTAVFPVQGINVSSGEADAIGLLLAQAYGQASGQEVVLPMSAKLADGESYSSAAVRLGAGEYLETSAVGLGSVDGDRKIILQSVRRNSRGETLFSASMNAMSMSDTDKVAERLAQALYRKTAPAQTRNLENITLSEGQTPNRTSSQKVIGVKFGFAYPASGSGRGYDGIGSVGFDMRLEFNQWFLEFGAGAILPATTSQSMRASYGGVFAEIGGNYYLTDGNVSPYLGGGISPRIIASDGGSPINFAPYVQAGLMFNRESRTRLYVDLRVAQNIAAVGQGTPASGGGIQSGYPTEIGLQIGIGF